MQSRSPEELKGLLSLLIVAIIWGGTLIPQKTALEHLTPFFFSGLRFCLGAFALWIFLTIQIRLKHSSWRQIFSRPSLKTFIFYAIFSGTSLFLGSSLQQIALLSVSVAKVAFISSLYVVAVPILQLFLGRFPSLVIWPSMLLVLSGLYVIHYADLSGTGFVGFSFHELILYGSVFAWALQVIIISRIAERCDLIAFGMMQCAVCGLLCLAFAFGFEALNWKGIVYIMPEILITSILSAALAFTLQVWGQRFVMPSHAVLILSTESLFAALIAYWILSEKISFHEWIGFGLMLSAVLLVQFRWRFGKSNPFQ